LKKILFLTLLILGLAMLPAPSQGSTVTFNLDTVFSGTAPANSAPWLGVTIADYATNEVKVTITDLDLVSGEFLGKKGLYLNIDPTLTFATFASSFVSGQQAVSVSSGEDAFKADGGGKYDILFEFAASGSGRFEPGESSVYILTLAGLTANSFLFEASPHGGNGVYFAASHVQGIPGDTCNEDDSGWIAAKGATVPEPLTLLLVGSGLIPFIRLRKKRSIFLGGV